MLGNGEARGRAAGLGAIYALSLSRDEVTVRGIDYYHRQHCVYRFAGSCMEGGMTGAKLDSIALWVLLMLLIMVPWALE